MSRILLAAALLVTVAAGCGGAARPQAAAPVVPRALARSWEGEASAIATAASAGDRCRALHLAVSLRDEVRQSEHKLPLRLRSPLVNSVDALAQRITCTPPVTTVPQKPPKPPQPPPDKHGGHEHHGHEKHGGGGKDK